MSASYRGTRARAVDAKGPKKSPFSPQCPPRLWPSCAADGAIRTALALPLRGTSPCSSEPPEARSRHGDTIFGENDTSARLASELLAQVVPPLFHYLCSPARIDIFEMAGRAGVALARDRQK